MKKNKLQKTLVAAVFSLSLLCLVLAVAAQTGEIPAPKANFEYLEPQNFRDFMLTLKEAGNRGFRLDKMTTMPSADAYSSKGKLKGLVVAGLVRFDGETRYDYNFFFAEGEENPETTLNALAKEGWAFRDVISIAGTGDASSWLIEDLYANRLRKMPTLGNVYLLERAAGRKTERSYKLLKAGVGTGRNPSAKLQLLLDQAVGEGFVPVGTYYSFDFKSLLTVDSFSGVIMEKRDDGKKYEYKFARGNQSDGLWKDIDELSKQGYRIDSINYSSAVLVREKDKTAPVSYSRVETEEKTFQTDLAAMLAKNPSFHSTAIYAQGLGDFNKNLLVFTDNAGGAASDIRFVKMIALVPKQFKKNPQEYLKTLENPEAAFQKAIEEGYRPQDIYYSGKEGLVVVFARDKKM